MLSQQQKIFRKESVERLASPERLDQLMQVVNPKSWLPLAGMSSILTTAFVWSIYGRIPVTLDGQGVLIYPHKVLPVQSKSSGQLVALNVKVGDVIKKGDTLAILDQPDLRKQLELANAKLVQLKNQNRNATLLQQERQDLDKRTLSLQRQNLQQNLETVQSITPLIREKGLVSIQRDRINLKERLYTIRQLLPTLKKRWKIREMLFAQGAVSDDVVLQSRQEYLDGLAKVDDAESQLKQLDFKEADAQRQYLQSLNSIKDFQAQLRDLDSKKATVEQQDLQTITTRNNEIKDLEREIAKLNQQLNDNSKIISQSSGRILEIAAVPGQILNPGSRIVTIETEDPSQRLVAVTYFSIADGKKIQPGMDIQITPQIIKRERFGGILGTVTNVSRFPITKEAAAQEVGNSDIVENLASRQEGLIQITSNMEVDHKTFSGYKWSSSKGPHVELSPGTTTTVRVKLEERAPITFVLPILREVTGIY
ncbi:NHLP bacteriocin system secretion protein [Aetokthonos hydrillicola Thurmond2011]|jgi:HlyD family secretion protein|uniref:NHLP bacteriocin system secretion protein n=1 Tax=Aetokthonos hydrillicola Thurmond2011 TaxID=2712845 RepID=A0AAP5MBF1_9CYAN|nr:NHLP bacteriocin system secretion protein [Aetokthonos hydrillicola]MBO3458647.1 NHLP bacteriocin system secretion protein [Aetokthonos hydrillicola CCALA 1050]MBW4588000.1 NHLP bacteriocin system secretion protein [Aetokthonos hydrillicola CCALA 1050]MDR9897048.1 NHLP bacteriocin system secretion protein [Aetokthonos hydrillicola Thurmond2011]